jgi:hypothetical protein
LIVELEALFEFGAGIIVIFAAWSDWRIEKVEK